MSLHLGFIGLEFIGAFVALLLTLVLLRSLPREPSAWLAAVVLLISVAFLLFQRAIMSFWIPEAYRIALPASMLLTVQVLMNTTPGVFMFLCSSLFRERRWPPAWLCAAFVVQLTLEDLLPALLGITTHPSQNATMTDESPLLALLFETTPAVLQALFVAVALYWAARDLNSDLVPLRRVLRAMALFVIGVGLVGYGLLSRLLIPTTSVLQLYVHEAFVAIGILQNTVFLLVLAGARGVELPPALEHVVAGPPADDSTLDLDAATFANAMAAGIYRETGLTIAGLAKHLHMPEYRLRRLVNERLGHRNFNAMLHSFRIAEAREVLADPARRDLPVLSIALSLGYQSINPFNRAFRELEGCAPTAWRHAQLAQRVDTTPTA